MQGVWRGFVSTALAAAAATLLPLAAHAGQGHASFHITITIAARQPAPRVIEHSASTASPGFPAPPALKDQVVKWENLGDDVVVLETEF